MFKKKRLHFTQVEAHHKGGAQRPSLISIKASFTPAKSGAALGVANANHLTTGAHLPPHYVVDETATYNCVADNVVAGIESLRKPGVVGVMICSEPMGDLEYWDDLTHARALEATARLVAYLCLTYKIPAAYLSMEGQERWSKAKWIRSRGGITVDVRGAWPRKEFMADVEAHLAHLKKN